MISASFVTRLDLSGRAFEILNFVHIVVNRDNTPVEFDPLKALKEWGYREHLGSDQPLREPPAERSPVDDAAARTGQRRQLFIRIIKKKFVACLRPVGCRTVTIASARFQSWLT